MNGKGYTLVEALISVALLSVVLAVAYAVLGTGRVMYNNDLYALDMSNQAKNALERISREVRESSSQTITVVDANHDKIVFTTPNEVNIQFYISGTDLIREYPVGTMKKIASHITRLKLSLNGKLLTIDLQASQTVGAKTYSTPLIERVRLRN